MRPERTLAHNDRTRHDLARLVDMLELLLHACTLPWSINPLVGAIESLGVDLAYAALDDPPDARHHARPTPLLPKHSSFESSLRLDAESPSRDTRRTRVMPVAACSRRRSSTILTLTLDLSRSGEHFYDIR